MGPSWPVMLPLHVECTTTLLDTRARAGDQDMLKHGGRPGAAPDSGTPQTFWPPEGGVGGQGGSWDGVPSTPTYMPQNDLLIPLMGFP